MHINKQGSDPLSKPTQTETSFGVEIHKAPIIWDLENGNLSFFGLDAALFWTDPSLIRVLAPLAGEVGNELFRLLIAYSSSQGAEKDYNAMVSILGNSFEEGFLAWGKAVSSAGWGTFELPEFDPDRNQATVIVHKRMGNQDPAKPCIRKTVGAVPSCKANSSGYSTMCSASAAGPMITVTTNLRRPARNSKYTLHIIPSKMS